MKVKPDTKKIDTGIDNVGKPPARYYSDLPLISDKQTLPEGNMNDSDSSEIESTNDSNSIKKRPALGQLPSFIPFDKDQCI